MSRREDVPPNTAQRPPRIAACFLIKFDQRVGYDIVWRRSVDGLEVDGVEYKSLPSGLHNVDEDLQYYIHQDHAGVSLFAHAPSTAAERHASFVSVGVLLPRGRSRLGRAWLHIAHLKELSRRLLQASDDSQALERYWDAHRLDGQGREAAAGILAAEAATPHSSEAHPILGAAGVLDTFGPLVFPLYREALLRRRILLFDQPPLRASCETVYALATLSSIAADVNRQLPRRAYADTHAAFVVSIHDIPALELDAAKSADGTPVPGRAASAGQDEALGSDEDAPTAGWIACTSDEILDTKTALSDLRVRMPRPRPGAASPRAWPELRTAEGARLQATPRDLRRYLALRQGLARLRPEPDGTGDNGDYDDDDDDDDGRARLIPRREAQAPVDAGLRDGQAIVEAESWASVAYNSYAAWASAGAEPSEREREREQDADTLLTAARSLWAAPDAPSQASPSMQPSVSVPAAAVPSAISAYFSTLTVSTLTTMMQVVDSAPALDGDDGGGVGRGPVPVTRDDLAAMGLDPGSKHDRAWVVRAVRLYFGREADVRVAGVECCGVKLY